MADQAGRAPEACPVDHKAREAWLAQARAAEASKTQTEASRALTEASRAQPIDKCPVDHAAPPAQKSWTQTITSYVPWTSSPTTDPATPTATAQPKRPGLGTDRVVSTIPRVSGPAGCPVEHGASANPSSPSTSVPNTTPSAAEIAAAPPANNEVETGAAADGSGNWVYPSEKMFFDAMRRKGYDARVADMATVVPIHNAVNEKAWEQVRAWEAPYLAQSRCGGPKLASFGNKAERMTPTARINTILGYAAPFDRHDWVVDRCGTRVDYVIDFYAGRPGGSGPGPSFYLDVRPKLNTWEGVRMRASRWVGLA